MISVCTDFCHMVAPDFITFFPVSFHFFFFNSLLSSFMPCVQTPNPALIPPSTISPHWLIPALASQDILLEAIRATNQNSHLYPPILFILLHHLHSRLPNEPKKPSCVLFAEKKKIPKKQNSPLVDTHHLIKTGRNSLNMEKYVRGEERCN